MPNYGLTSLEHIEYNQARFVGVRIGGNGQSVYYSSSVAAGLVVIYTVPADTVLNIYNTWLSGYSGGGAGQVYLGVFDAVPANVYEIGRMVLLNGGDYSESQTLARIFPICVPEGYSIQLSAAAGISAYGGFEGVLGSV